MNNNNVTTVNNIYEAFVKGDVSTIMNYLSDEVEWEPWTANYGHRPGFPWVKEGKGKDGALELFMIVGGFIFNKFRVLSVIGNENHVAAEIQFEAEIPATGGHLKQEAIHLWTFNNKGEVIRLRHYSDTAKQIVTTKADSQIHKSE